ncbi:hypothetical protein [Actinoplanes sp. URMC 104]|uniref:ATP dependent DNA ligase n=1 Tax=Actinoplanes sp. URMC 104 TaxID=3423409 RepID=UPI003F1B7C0E
MPLTKTQEVIVVGWTAGEGRRAGTIGSLLLAVFDERDRLMYAGHVGTGFTDLAPRRLRDELGTLARATPPVADAPREHARHAHWVEPVLVGEVVFRSWTADHRLRHAAWRSLRRDRSPPRYDRPLSRSSRRRRAPSWVRCRHRMPRGGSRSCAAATRTSSG